MIMYATKSELEKRIGADTLVILADDNNDGAADDAVINAALDQASSRMDAILGARYAVPLDPVPPVLAWISVSLAVPLLFARQREALPPDHAGQEAAAMEFLSLIRRGEISLSGISPRTLSESTTRGEEKHFSPGRLSEF